MNEYVKLLEAPSGRWAILIRETLASPWVQVESCLTRGDAEETILLYGYMHNEDKRREHIAEYINELWDDDAPII